MTIGQSTPLDGADRLGDSLVSMKERIRELELAASDGAAAVEEAPIDGAEYVRKDAGWVEHPGNVVWLCDNTLVNGIGSTPVSIPFQTKNGTLVVGVSYLVSIHAECRIVTGNASAANVTITWKIDGTTKTGGQETRVWSNGDRFSVDASQLWTCDAVLPNGTLNYEIGAGELRTNNTSTRRTYVLFTPIV